LVARRAEALRIGHKDASLMMRLCAPSQDEALKAAAASLNRVATRS
jgi:hypothetical protein